MQDNKGQVLVAFILLIPVFLMLLALIVDVGFLYVEKRKTDNVIKDTINYGLDNLNLQEGTLQTKLTKLINSNLDDVQRLNIQIDTNSIEINITRNKQSIFSNVYKDASYKIVSDYVGNITDLVKDIRKGS
jgi:Flp pilus assembly protein TadG